MCHLTVSLYLVLTIIAVAYTCHNGNIPRRAISPKDHHTKDHRTTSTPATIDSSTQEKPEQPVGPRLITDDDYKEFLSSINSTRAAELAMLNSRHSLAVALDVIPEQLEKLSKLAANTQDTQFSDILDAVDRREEGLRNHLNQFSTSDPAVLMSMDTNTLARKWGVTAEQLQELMVYGRTQGAMYAAILKIFDAVVLREKIQN